MFVCARKDISFFTSEVRALYHKITEQDQNHASHGQGYETCYSDQDEADISMHGVASTYLNYQSFCRCVGGGKCDPSSKGLYFEVGLIASVFGPVAKWSSEDSE